MKKGPRLLLVTVWAVALVGCGSDSAHPVEPSAAGSAGAAAAGGANNVGGQEPRGGVSTGSGGEAKTGGTTASGGVVARGGSSPTGGVTTDGGRIGAGGTPSTGGITSGGTTPGSGGLTAVAGTAGGGGTTANGGTLATGGTQGPAGGGGAAPTFHVFLLLGQSNMAGYAKAQAADKTEDERVRVLGYDDCAETGRQVDKWDTAAPPLHECWNSALGPGDYFAKTLVGSIPMADTIGLVPCAISGEKIETFLKSGGTKYNWIVARAKLAQQAGGVIEGMIFHQGESNSGDSSWPGKVSTLVKDLRTELGLGEVPFLAGELPYSGNASGHNTQVNKLPALIPNGYVVSASGLAVDPADTQWNLHFDHDSTVTLGKRYAEKMLEALSW